MARSRIWCVSLALLAAGVGCGSGGDPDKTNPDPQQVGCDALTARLQLDCFRDVDVMFDCYAAEGACEYEVVGATVVTTFANGARREVSSDSSGMSIGVLYGPTGEECGRVEMGLVGGELLTTSRPKRGEALMVWGLPEGKYAFECEGGGRVTPGTIETGTLLGCNMAPGWAEECVQKSD